MSQRPRPRLALLMATALVLGLSGCAVQPVEVPDDAAPPTEILTPTRTASPTATAAPVDGERLTRSITDCLARYGLRERPPMPDDSLTMEERIAADRLVAAYDEALTTCSAESMATAAPAPTPAP